MSLTGIVAYGGGPESPRRPGTIRTGTGTAPHGELLLEVVVRGDDSSSDHSHQSEGRPPDGGRGPHRGGRGGDPPPNGNGNGNGNGDGDEGDESSISSHSGPPGTPKIARTSGSPGSSRTLRISR